LKLDELQEATEALPVPSPELRLGISGGIAVFPEDGRSYEALLALADSRMYRNKAARKNCPVAVRTRSEAVSVADLGEAAGSLHLHAGIA
jgi:predicted signal transduction protein with EAL and GGDEF domain